MKPGTRALGVAESYPRDADRSTLAAAVVRADRAVDGFAFGSCTVGGTDATERIAALVRRLGRPDARYLFLSGVALSWYNVVSLDRLAAAVDRPVVALSFEESAGLEPAIRDAFTGEAAETRLDAYRALPERRPVDVGEDTVYARSVGLDEAETERVVRGFTATGGRPEPVRVAREAARAADDFRRGGTTDGSD